MSKIHKNKIDKTAKKSAINQISEIPYAKCIVILTYLLFPVILKIFLLYVLFPLWRNGEKYETVKIRQMVSTNMWGPFQQFFLFKDEDRSCLSKLSF